MKQLIESWRKFLKEEEEDVEPKEVLAAYSYCSIILDKHSQKTLKEQIEQLKPNGFLNADEATDKKLCHHITINMGTTNKFPDVYTHKKEIIFNVVSYLEHINDNGDGVAAVVVSSPKIKVSSGNPHITVFLNNMSPGKAADLKQDGKLKPTSVKDFNIVGLRGIVNIPSEVE